MKDIMAYFQGALITVSATPEENLSPRIPLFSDGEVVGLVQ